MAVRLPGRAPGETPTYQAGAFAAPWSERAKGVVVTFLIVGLDRMTLAPWHRNVMAGDASSARRIGSGCAAREGVELIVAAVIGPGAAVLGAQTPGRA
jgi:hypothetical protein